MSDMFQVLALMAIPATILSTIRYLIVRDNRAATDAGNGVEDPPAR